MCGGRDNLKTSAYNCTLRKLNLLHSMLKHICGRIYHKVIQNILQSILKSKWGYCFFTCVYVGKSGS